MNHTSEYAHNLYACFKIMFCLDMDHICHLAATFFTFSSCGFFGGFCGGANPLNVKIPSHAMKLYTAHINCRPCIKCQYITYTKCIPYT